MFLRPFILITALFFFSCQIPPTDKTVVAQTETPSLSNTPAQQFWNTLQSHCGKAYEGALELPLEDEAFGGKRLTMHVISCSESEIKIPFNVGDDRSRTWILTYQDDRITLKHGGKADIQFFPADPHTQKLIPAAATNVWWITINESEFTYNLKRLGTDRIFKVVMDLTTTIETPMAPWGIRYSLFGNGKQPVSPDVEVQDL